MMINRLREAAIIHGALFQSISRGVARKKTPRARLNSYSKQPELFKLQRKIKKFDFRKPDITFPINIRMKLRYIYRPAKNITPTPPTTDFINFKRMTGNEILLNMKNSHLFRNEEVVECLKCFLLIENVMKHDWHEHEYFQMLQKRINTKFSQFTNSQKVQLVRMMTKLKIRDEEFWGVAYKQFQMLYPNLNGKEFGIFYVDLLSRPECPEEMKIEMTKILPRELRNFSKNECVKAFQIVVENDLLNERLWHNHFHIIFWRRPRWIGAHNFSKVIDGMVKIDYLEEVDWWNDSFLPSIDYFVNDLLDGDVAQQLILSLEQLGSRQPLIETKSYIKKLSERIIYLKTKYVLLQSAHFYKMVQQDIEYFKEKEMAKRELKV